VLSSRRRSSVRAITLRNVPGALARVIRRKAAEGRTSINRTVIRLLEESVGNGPSKPGKKGEGRPPHHDLDKLAGCWGKEDAAAFEETLKAQRVIDPGLWK
jgi:hypothetical protein